MKGKREKVNNNIMRIIIRLILLFILIYMGLEFYKENKIKVVEDSIVEKIDGTSEAKNEIEIKRVVADVPEEYLGYNVTARLEIPKINLNTNVLGEYSNQGLKQCASKFWGPEPNEIGNFCIAGHNYKRANMFNHLIDLEIGDEIYLSDNKNGKCVYTIYDKYKVNENNTKCLSQDTNGKKEITLITCVNYSNNRLIIKAIQK